MPGIGILNNTVLGKPFSWQSYWKSRFPQDLIINFVSETQYKLDWENNGTGSFLISIERNTDDGSYSELATLSSTTRTYTDEAALEGFKHSYRIRYKTGSNYSDYSNVVNNLTGDYLSSLTGEWLFNEGEGTTANDNISTNNGTITGADWVTGKSGSALYFNGIDDIVDLGNILDSTFTGANAKFSISAWIKPAGAMTNSYIVGANVTSGQEFVFRLLTNNIVDFTWYGAANGSTWYRYYGDTQLTDTSKWYHVVVSYDGTLALASRIKIYINGVSESLSVDNAGTPSYIQNTTAKKGIGGKVNNPLLNLFYGTIDSVQIYNRVLTYSDILALSYFNSNTRKVTHIFNGTDIGTAYTQIADVTTQTIFAPSTILVDTYNFHPYLKQIGNRIWLFFTTNSRDEDKQGSYIRACYSDDNGSSWSVIMTACPSFYESPDLGTDQVAKNPYPVDVIKVNNIYYLILDVQESTFVADDITTRTGVGFLSVEFSPALATFETPLWIHKVGTDDTFGVADNADSLMLRITVGGKMYRWTIGIADVFPLNLTAGIEDVLTESVVYKYDNIYMRLSRWYGGAYTDQYIYYQLSNNGVTWGIPIITTIPNEPSLVNHLTHSSGKELLVFNPQTDVYRRDPVSLGISIDGITWNPYKIVTIGSVTPVYAGYHKNVAGSYMHSIELSDGSILCAYGVWKEQIRISRFNLP